MAGGSSVAHSAGSNGGGRNTHRRQRIGARFVLYVEGPRDRDLLHIWARRLAPDVAREIDRSTVILGGRQPARALAHFRKLRLEVEDAAGLCVLDRDGQPDREADADQHVETGLEFFTWPRRHIESYLLVPEAIQRAFVPAGRDGIRVDPGLWDLFPRGADERALRSFDAKRALSEGGALARDLGIPISTAGIARAMRAGEIDSDVRGLLERVRRRAGLATAAPTVVVRKS